MSAEASVPDEEKEKFLHGLIEVLRSFVAASPPEYTPSVFATGRVPGISIGRFVRRLSHYTKCEDRDFIICLILIDRLLYNRPYQYRLNMYVFHRLFVTALVVAIKSRQDIVYTNQYYSEVGGVTLQQLNAMEEEFLLALDWDVYVDKEIFDNFMYEIAQRFDFGGSNEGT
eukprot:TRINITY_DN21520_c0_g1_i1.p1 TRINITY_DN21520_c0_g1~~TRINITY_DN21520_c0_g1_i1.p1  ORF type:complete len:171 (+),score=19.85 TRINITY_DN21520_c0_g1_i1:58-570(+)